MAGINKVVNITVRASSPGVTRPGFGVPLILSQNATFQERTRVYTSADAVSDDFGAGSPEYNAANAIFSQQPATKRIRIGRASTNPVTQRWGVGVVLAGVVNVIYKLYVWTADGVKIAAQYTTALLTTTGTAVSAQFPTIYIPLSSFQAAFKVKVDGGGAQSFLFGASPGYKNGAAGVFAGAAGNFVVRKDGDAATDQTIHVLNTDNTLEKIVDKITAQAQGFGCTTIGGQLSLQSARFGSGSLMQVLSGDAGTLTDLGLTVGIGGAGTSACQKVGGTGAIVAPIPFYDAATPQSIIDTIALCDGGITGGSLFLNAAGHLCVATNTAGAGGSIQVDPTSVAFLGFDTAVHTGSAGNGSTNDQIIAGLKAAVDALPGLPAVTTSIVGAGGSHTLRITANASTVWFAMEIDDPTYLRTYQDHDAPAGNGLVTDLQALARSSTDWYGLITLYNSPAYILAAAQTIEGIGTGGSPKLYTPDSADTDCATIAESTPATDVLHVLKAQNRSRTAGAFHQRAAEWFAACQMSRFFTIDPGGDNWRMKGLSGPTTGWANGDELTDTQTTNLEDKNANYYINLGVPTVLGDGKTAGGPLVFIDNLRGLDWLSAETGTDLFNMLYGVDKLPMTDVGGAAIENILNGEVQKGIKAQLINKGSPPTIPIPKVTVPAVASLPTGDRTARDFTGTSMAFILAGAVDRIFVTINVEL